MKKRLFRTFVRIIRTLFKIAEMALGIVFRKDAISSKYSANYQQQEIWNTEYRIWEANKNEFLAKGEARACPACTSANQEPLWKSEDGYDYVQCRDCDFVYVTPFFTYDLWREHFRRFEKDTELINRAVIDSRFEETYLKEDRERFSFYLDFLQKYKKTGSVLDVGCLTGSFLKFAQERGYSPQGVEYREYAIEAAKKRFGIDITQGFFEELADSMLKSGDRFDIITLWETLEHMLYPDAVIRNANQLLAQGGLLAVSVPNFDNLQVKMLRERCFHCLGGPGNAGHINMFTPFTLDRMLRRHNFEILLMETEGASSYYDILAHLSGRYELINSYRNALSSSWKKPSQHPHFLSPALMNSALALSPLLKIVENALLKGAIIFTIARKKD